MQNDNVIDLAKPENTDTLTELLRESAHILLAQAIEAEVEEALAGFAGQTTANGRRRVVRNGHQPAREIATGIGKIEVQVPKIRSREGSAESFQSVLVPPYMRRAPTLDAAIPWLYLRGISTGNMQPALEALLGERAKGFSPGVVSRLKRRWEVEYRDWMKRDLSGDEWVYIWADAIHSKLRGDEKQRMCMLVVIGVNRRGQKHFLAIEDGWVESEQSWREVLLSLRHRGLRVSPKLAVADGAGGFWNALGEVYPDTVGQRCWVHKTNNVLNYMAKSVRGKAKQAIQDIWHENDRSSAEKALDHFVEVYGAKYSKAVDCLQKDRESLLAFYDFPAEHWHHIRTTNVIESSFATIRHRSRQTRGCVSRTTMLTMAFKMAMSVEKSWKRLRGFRHLAKVIEGVQFKDGIEVVEVTEEHRAVA